MGHPIATHYIPTTILYTLFQRRIKCRKSTEHEIQIYYDSYYINILISKYTYTQSSAITLLFSFELSGAAFLCVVHHHLLCEYQHNFLYFYSAQNDEAWATGYMQSILITLTKLCYLTIRHIISRYIFQWQYYGQYYKTKYNNGSNTFEQKDKKHIEMKKI